jgi:deoxyadenosine/deoxycytidine kinase
MDNQKTLVVVAGPTAIGKTNLAIQLHAFQLIGHIGIGMVIEMPNHL